MIFGFSVPATNGAPVDNGNPLPTRRARGIGTTASINLPDVSTLGTALLTVAVNSSRARLQIKNLSPNALTIVCDDGSGGQIWMDALIGTGLGLPGSEWSTDTFTGRVRVYGAAGSRVSAWEL